jgi:hypothetical protein
LKPSTVPTLSPWVRHIEKLFAGWSTLKIGRDSSTKLGACHRFD